MRLKGFISFMKDVKLIKDIIIIIIEVIKRVNYKTCFEEIEYKTVENLRNVNSIKKAII